MWWMLAWSIRLIRVRGTGVVTVRVPVAGITVTPESLIVPPGGTGQFTSTFSPEDASDKRVVWTSSDSGVATVSPAGLVTGYDVGYVTITVETRDGGYSATAHVRVGIPATGVDVEPATLFLMHGDRDKVTAIVHPPDATEPEVVWTSSNGAVATVNGARLVTGVSLGIATIRVTTTDGGHTDSTRITVIAPPPGYEVISAGTFTMGSPESELGHSDNETQHVVTITRRFFMKATPVTQGEWQALMGNNPSYFTACQSCPVERVSWYMTLAYANALSASEGLPQCFDCVGSGEELVCELKGQYATPQQCPGYRLPTEAEWEYAARAGSVTAFHTGNITKADVCPNMDRAGWYRDNSDKQSQPVRGKMPNNWSLYDMHGNVLEWVWDLYEADLGSDSVIDPYGPSVGEYRVRRGGS